MFIKKNNNKISTQYLNESGVTLVELMITVAISGFVIAAIYMSYRAQQRATTVQDHVSEMQQTLRGTIAVLEGELRMAGYNPDNNAIMTDIIDANSTKIIFQYFDDEDSAIETISYNYDSAEATLDRTKGGTLEAISEDIDSIEFYYTLEDGTQTLTPAGQLDNIRSIQISILARSQNEDSDYTNTNTYTTASGAIINPTPDDGYRRRQLFSTVQLRNIGL